jgi:hypothetical protein
MIRARPTQAGDQGRPLDHSTGFSGAMTRTIPTTKILSGIRLRRCIPQPMEMHHMSDLSRHSLVIGEGALPAVAVPAVVVAAKPDPIFAAIERWMRLLKIEEAAECAHEQARSDRELLKAADKAGDERYDAMWIVLETVPTTLAGMRAKIDFIIDDRIFEGIKETDNGVQDAIETLYEAARRVMTGGTGANNTDHRENAIAGLRRRRAKLAHQIEMIDAKLVSITAD